MDIPSVIWYLILFGDSGHGVQKLRVGGSRFSPVAGLKNGQLNQKRKKFCCFVSAVLGLWERFLTAISRVIVAEGHSHQPLTST